jgi:hypothetical protein
VVSYFPTQGRLRHEVSIPANYLWPTKVDGNNSLTYPTANLALYTPVSVYNRILVTHVWWINGNTAGTDSIDVGLYDRTGVRLTSGGGTLASGTNVLQETAVTNVLISPGNYFVGIACNGTTTTFRSNNTLLARELGAFGMLQQASAYPLPATATFAAMATTFFALHGVAGRSLA